MPGKIILVLGGARSGKSSFAVELASGLGHKVLFCATAEPLDDEMRARIEAHKKTRPSSWTTLESATNIAAAIGKSSAGHDAVIIDCMTLLLSNLLGEGIPLSQCEQSVAREMEELLTCLGKKESNYIIVSNEVGQGLVPENGLARTYRDMLGKINQQLAACADEVYLMVARLPVKIK